LRPWRPAFHGDRVVRDPAALASALAPTALGGRQVVWARSINGFTVDCEPEESVTAWQAARTVVTTTGRWPVLTMSGEQLHGGPYARDFPPPPDPLAGLELPDVARVVPDLLSQRWPYREQIWDPFVEQELGRTARDVGSAPERADVDRALGGRRSHVELNRLLLDWELAHGGVRGPIADDYLSWYVPQDDPIVVAFPPTPHGWASLAYLQLFPGGGAAGRLDAFLAIARSWEQRFGAELVANWVTMLQFVVGRPPATIEDAWQLAVEQDLVAPSTTVLPGVPLRRHAQNLIGRPNWFLHERP
jgi:hypothetical protein